MKRTRFFAALLAGAALAALVAGPFADPARACVGRKLVLGSLSQERDAMASRVVSILVHERTGTTVELRFFPSEEELVAAAKEGKVDIYLGFAGTGAPPEQALAAARKRDDEEFNLVWGKPLGCEGRSPSGVSRGPAAPVVRKDTLKKFPALPRLLEKLGGKVPLDDATVDLLVAKGKEGKEEQAARDWLKEVRLI